MTLEEFAEAYPDREFSIHRVTERDRQPPGRWRGTWDRGMNWEHTYGDTPGDVLTQMMRKDLEYAKDCLERCSNEFSSAKRYLQEKSDHLSKYLKDNP